MNINYTKGFISKCAEYGVNPGCLIKSARTSHMYTLPLIELVNRINPLSHAATWLGERSVKQNSKPVSAVGKSTSSTVPTVPRQRPFNPIGEAFTAPAEIIDKTNTDLREQGVLRAFFNIPSNVFNTLNERVR